MLNTKLSYTHFNPNLEIIEASEVIDYGIGAVICHDFKDAKIKVVAGVSSTLNATVIKP